MLPMRWTPLALHCWHLITLTAEGAVSTRSSESEVGTCSSDTGAADASSSSRAHVGALLQKDNMLQRHPAAAALVADSSLASAARGDQPDGVFVPSTSADYGSGDCPCVGLDNVTGRLNVTVSGSTLLLPGDLGGHCEAWDNQKHPLCKEGGTGPDWCSQPWCFVDPCRCSIPTLPKISSYLSNASFRGRTVYYSYATCGGKDSWTTNNSAVACQNLKTEADCNKSSTKCTWAKGFCGGKEIMSNCTDEPNEIVWGQKGCRCVGIGGRGGSLDLVVDGKGIQYPGDTGSSCAAWDSGPHPKCAGNSTDRPKWCENQWCYVDPCSCDLGTPPKIATYTVGGMFQGRRLYYSYSTCNSTDTWTSDNNAGACVNQKSADTCSALSKCRWTEYSGCLGMELAAVCDLSSKKPAAPQDIPAAPPTTKPTAAPASGNASNTSQTATPTAAPLTTGPILQTTLLTEAPSTTEAPAKTTEAPASSEFVKPEVKGEQDNSAAAPPAEKAAGSEPSHSQMVTPLPVPILALFLFSASNIW